MPKFRRLAKQNKKENKAPRIMYNLSHNYCNRVNKIND